MVRNVLTLAVLGFAVLVGIGLGPDFPKLETAAVAEYHYHAEWASYLAPEEDCPGGEDTDAPPGDQRQTMLCLLNWARARHGLSALPTSRVLTKSAAMKARVMVACDEFAHAPCGVTPDEGARSLGYKGSFGENISWGNLVARAPRPTVDGWLHSPGHRTNLLRPQWREQGIALLRADRYQGTDDAAVWVSQFGS
jgi:uncharacterized protein YkwD